MVHSLQLSIRDSVFEILFLKFRRDPEISLGASKRIFFSTMMRTFYCTSQYAHNVVLTSVRRRVNVMDVVWTSKRRRVLTGLL